MPFITKGSVKKYHKRKNVEEIWLKYNKEKKEKIDKIDQQYKEDVKRDKTNKDKGAYGGIMNICHHALWGLVGKGKKHFSKFK